jgi:hypothetical protein
MQHSSHMMGSILISQWNMTTSCCYIVLTADDCASVISIFFCLSFDSLVFATSVVVVGSAYRSSDPALSSLLAAR